MDEKLLELVEDLFNVAEDDHQEILQLYKESRNNIKQFIANMFMEYGTDGKIDYPEFQRLHMTEVEEYLQEQADEMAQLENAIFPIILGGLVATTYYKSAFTMEQSLGIGVNFNLLRQEFIDETVNFNWSGVPFSERIWDNQDALVKSLRTELSLGLSEGESLDKIARRINKQFDSKADESLRLVQTESARVMGEAQDKIYEDSGVIKEVEWVATLERNTCSICADLDGQRFRLDNKNKPRLPKHPKCKCTYSPVPYSNYKTTIRKDNETKEFVEVSNFEEWAKRKGIK